MKNRNRKSSTKMPQPVIAVLALAALLLLPQAARAEGVVTPQVFSRGSFVFVVEQQRIVFLSMDTRSSYAVYSADDEMFNIVSAVRSGDMIWASNAIGAVIAVNMQTGTVEEFSRGRVSNGGYIDVDRRFVWLAAADTLYRMDIITREWVPMPIPNSGGDVRGLMSFNDQIHIVSEGAVHVLSMASEDWVIIPHKNFALTRGDFRTIDGIAYITQARAIYRYDPSKRMWDKGSVRAEIRAVHLSPDFLMVAAGNRLYNFNTRNFVLEAYPALPVQRDIRAVTSSNYGAVGVTGGGLVLNPTSLFNFDIAACPSNIRIGDDVFAFGLDGYVILYTGGNFVFYNHYRKMWSTVRVVTRVGNIERKALHGWSEEGAHMNLSEDLHSSVHGGVTIRQHPSLDYNEETGTEVNPMSPLANALINIHTEDADGRVLDLTVDNAETTLPPQKGFYYKGLDGDILDRASFGVQQNLGISANRTMPEAVTEGGSAVFTSVSRARGSNRPTASATAGGGHILSKTIWRTYGYNPTGTFPLYALDQNREIAVSTIRLYIDGIPLPGSDYAYDARTNNIRLLRLERTNPTSVIQVSFSEKVLPKEAAAFEPLPEAHFGSYGFAEGAISPRSWLSARAGVMARGKATTDSLVEFGTATVFASLPVEWRGGANSALLINPEIAYDPTMGAHAAGISAGAREGRAFGSYRGFWTSREYNGYDRVAQSFDDRRINDEHEVNLGYDLRDDLRTSWYQIHRRTEGANISHFELRSSYSGNGYILPGVDLSLSSRFMDYASDNERRDRKETVTLRLSDPSSRFLSEVNRLHNVGYDFSWTEYHTTSGQDGRVLYGLANISPTSPLTITGSWLYRLNPSDYDPREEYNPSVSISARGLPRGFDLGASYSLYVADRNSGGNHIAMGRGANLIFYPGEYVRALDKFILYLGYGNETVSHAPAIISPMRYVFFTDENTYLRATTEEAGFLYLPTENLLFSTINTRTTDQNSDAVYTSRDRVKWWMGNGGSLEGILQINKVPDLFNLRADGMYERRFESGITAGAGIAGGRDSVDTYAGPQFIMSQVKDLNTDFFKNIEHSHHLRILLHTSDMSTPDADYSLYLRLKMPPNISIVAEIGLAIKRLEKINGVGGIYLHAGF
ncbi:MAG: hypothetical protein FWC23_05835 [Chitinispirillia bacterium]|nr:hypothetical protein [Chitinispirillia bacterium]MCL2268688.1 hypothetical protein [Chitinispirillia bacterium]